MPISRNYDVLENTNALSYIFLNTSRFSFREFLLSRSLSSFLHQLILPIRHVLIYKSFRATWWLTNDTTLLGVYSRFRRAINTIELHAPKFENKAACIVFPFSTVHPYNQQVSAITRGFIPAAVGCSKQWQCPPAVFWSVTNLSGNVDGVDIGFTIFAFGLCSIFFFLLLRLEISLFSVTENCAW